MIRRFFWFLAGGVSVLVTAALIGAKAEGQAPRQPRVVRAEAFELVDARGQVRAALHADPMSQDVRLSLFDAKKRERVTISATDTGDAVISLISAGELPVLLLAMRGDDPSVLLYDPAAKAVIPAPRVHLTVAGQRGVAMARLLDGAGNETWSEHSGR